MNNALDWFKWSIINSIQYSDAVRCCSLWTGNTFSSRVHQFSLWSTYTHREKERRVFFSSCISIESIWAARCNFMSDACKAKAIRVGSFNSKPSQNLFKGFPVVHRIIFRPHENQTAQSDIAAVVSVDVVVDADAAIARASFSMLSCLVAIEYIVPHSIYNKKRRNPHITMYCIALHRKLYLIPKIVKLKLVDEWFWYMTPLTCSIINLSNRASIFTSRTLIVCVFVCTAIYVFIYINYRS